MSTHPRRGGRLLLGSVDSLRWPVVITAAPRSNRGNGRNDRIVQSLVPLCRSRRIIATSSAVVTPCSCSCPPPRSLRALARSEEQRERWRGTAPRYHRPPCEGRSSGTGGRGLFQIVDDSAPGPRRLVYRPPATLSSPLWGLTRPARTDRIRPLELRARRADGRWCDRGSSVWTAAIWLRPVLRATQRSQAAETPSSRARECVSRLRLKASYSTTMSRDRPPRTCDRDDGAPAGHNRLTPSSGSTPRRSAAPRCAARHHQRILDFSKMRPARHPRASLLRRRSTGRAPETAVARQRQWLELTYYGLPDPGWLEVTSGE